MCKKKEGQRDKIEKFDSTLLTFNHQQIIQPITTLYNQLTTSCLTEQDEEVEVEDGAGEFNPRFIRSKNTQL